MTRGRRAESGGFGLQRKGLVRCLARRSLSLLVAVALVLGAAAPAGAAVAHTVAPGETLSGIAAVNGLSTPALAAFNGLSAETMVVAGSTVMVPAPGELAASAGVSAGAPAPGASASAWVPATAPHLHPHPTNELLTAPRVGDLGQRTAGMSRSLVQAVGWQESRFNNALMSSAGARGVMQIMPATWNFIYHRLAGHGLHPASAADNVRAGSLYLHYLYHLKGSRDGTIASYYQGPNRTTLLPETHSYLHSVQAHQRHFRQPGH